MNSEELLKDVLIRLSRVEAKLDLVNEKLQYHNGIMIDQGDDYEEKIYDDARLIVIEKQRATSILLQNEMKIGHPRASRLLEILEKEGIIGPADENNIRKVLIQDPRDISKIIKNNDKTVKNIDIFKYPTTLITGKTSFDKPILFHELIKKLIKKYSSKELKLLLVDCEMLEFGKYKDSPHLYAPIQSNGYNSKVFTLFFDLEDEIKKRVKDKKSKPLILIVINEYAELIHSRRKRFEEFVRQISKMGKETGVCLVFNTENTDKNILTFSIKTDVNAIIEVGE
jgi:DNA segregation ATPase FtsK/SpoIIIE-like protein